MSEELTLSQKLIEIANKKRHYNLTGSQLKFILAWADLTKDFGFVELTKRDNSISMAVSFYKHVEREWQDKVLNNSTSLEFPDYFYATAQFSGLSLPSGFVDAIQEETKKITENYKKEYL